MYAKEVQGDLFPALQKKRLEFDVFIRLKACLRHFCARDVYRHEFVSIYCRGRSFCITTMKIQKPICQRVHRLVVEA